MSAIQDAYNQIGADFDDVLRRFTSEKLIVRFAEKFLEDGSFEQLGEALRNDDADAAFLASHTLKGVAQNMGFTGLYKPSDALTEELRAKPADLTRAKELFAPVEVEYGKTAEALRAALEKRGTPFGCATNEKPARMLRTMLISCGACLCPANSLPLLRTRKTSRKPLRFRVAAEGIT